MFVRLVYCCTRKIIHLTYINTGEEQFEELNSFKCLGTAVNPDSSAEEIKERITAGNRAYRVHKIGHTMFTKIGHTMFTK